MVWFRKVVLPQVMLGQDGWGQVPNEKVNETVHFKVFENNVKNQYTSRLLGVVSNTEIVVVTLSLATAKTVIVVVTLPIVAVKIEIVSTILLC